MLLVADIGNTQTHLGVYEGARLICSWRLSTRAADTSDEILATLRALLAGYNEPLPIEDVAIASVVPPLSTEWVAATRSLIGANDTHSLHASNSDSLSASSSGSLGASTCESLGDNTCDSLGASTCDSLSDNEPLLLTHTIPVPLTFDYETPEGIGADRIADAVAAVSLYGAPVLIVDFGTATNIEIIDNEGDFVGGILAPGLVTSAEALFSAAARLSRIDIETPATVIGKSTQHAVQAGLTYGEIDRIDGLVKRVFDELGYTCPVVATGGLSRRVLDLSSTITNVNDSLTLEGLRLIHEYNSEK